MSKMDWSKSKYWGKSYDNSSYLERDREAERKFTEKLEKRLKKEKRALARLKNPVKHKVTKQERLPYHKWLATLTPAQKERYFERKKAKYLKTCQDGK